jgi:transcriptional regulator with XRE-family HTH domain
VNSKRLAELINEERRRRGPEGRPLSLRAAAERVGISHVALSDILKERTQPSPETCMRIADYLGISVGAVLELAGHVPPGAVGPGDLSPAQQEAARLIEDLPDEAWRYAALDQLRRLKQLAGEGRGARVVGGEAARLIEGLPNERWRYAALEQLRRLQDLAADGTESGAVGGEAEEEGKGEEAESRRPESV